MLFIAYLQALAHDVEVVENNPDNLINMVLLNACKVDAQEGFALETPVVDADTEKQEVNGGIGGSLKIAEQFLLAHGHQQVIDYNLDHITEVLLLDFGSAVLAVDRI